MEGPRKFSLAEFLPKLPLPATETWPQGVWDIDALRRGDLTLLLFAPRHVDYQTPHTQDELYIIVRGKGVLTVEDQEIRFESGDVLFVPAMKKHRFSSFSDDFAAWAVFWGPHAAKPRHD